MGNTEMGGYVPPEIRKIETVQSELSPGEKERVAAFQPSNDVIEKARAVLIDACTKIGLPTPDEAVVEQTAKIIGALGEERVPRDLDGGPHKLWLLNEGFINAGKDPSPINEAALSSLLGGKPEARANSPETEHPAEINLGPLSEYVKLISDADIGKRLGYGDTPGHEYCKFSLKNGNGVDLMMDPYGIDLKPGEVLISFRDRMSSPKYNRVVSSPSEALRLIKEHGVTK